MLKKFLSLIAIFYSCFIISSEPRMNIRANAAPSVSFVSEILPLPNPSNVNARPAEPKNPYVDPDINYDSDSSAETDRETREKRLMGFLEYLKSLRALSANR